MKRINPSTEAGPGTPADPGRTRGGAFRRAIDGPLGMALIVVLIAAAVTVAVCYKYAGRKPDQPGTSSSEDLNPGHLRNTVTYSEDCLTYRADGDGCCAVIGLHLRPLKTLPRVLEIPERTARGDIVTAIDDRAFPKLPGVSSVTLPGKLRRIGRDAFPPSSGIFHMSNGLLYLGSAYNPYMALLGIADTSVTAYTLREETVIVADGALSFPDEPPENWRIAEINFPAGLVYLGFNDLAQRAESLRLTFAGTAEAWRLIGNGRLKGDDLFIECRDGRFYTSATVYIDERTAYNHAVLGSHSYVSDHALFAEVEPIRRLTDLIRRAGSENYTMFLFDSVYPFGTEPHLLTDEEMRAVSLSVNEWSHDEDVERMVADYTNGKFSSRPVAAFLLPAEPDRRYEKYRVKVEVTDAAVEVSLTPLRAESPCDMSVTQMVLLPLPPQAPSLRLNRLAVRVSILDPAEDGPPSA